MPLNDVGIFFDLDLLLVMIGHRLGEVCFIQKQADFITALAVWRSGQSHHKFDHVPCGVLKTLNGKNIVTFQLSG